MKQNNSEHPQRDQNSYSETNRSVITSWQSTSIVASTIIGIGILTLPRTASTDAHEAAWMVTILGGLLAFFSIWICTRLGLRFPGQTFVEFAPEILGNKRYRWVGKVLSFPFVLLVIAYWFLMTVTVARTFGEVVVTAVLPRTPLEIIIGTMLAMGVLLVLYEVEVLARFNEIVLPIILIPILMMAVASLQRFRLDNLLPLLTVEWFSLLKSAFSTMTVYSGLEIVIVLVAYTQQEKIIAANIKGVAISVVLYTLIVVAAVSVFGYEEMQLLAWPTLELVKSTNIPGLILERLESAFLGVWVAAVYTTVGNIYYVACLSVSHLLPFPNKKRVRKWIAVLLPPLIYWCSLLPQNIYALFYVQKIFSYITVGIMLIIPLLFYGIAVMRKKGRGVLYADNQ